MSADLTIGHAHRTALRRLDRGEPVGDLGETLGALYLHDLIRDGADGRPELSPDGRKVLEAHDAAVETRRLPRPTPTLPAGWRVDVVRGYVHDVHALVRPWGCDEALGGDIARARDTLALLEWIEHSRAVEAQEDAR